MVATIKPAITFDPGSNDATTKKQKMENVIIKNYGLDIEAAINEALLKCQNNATDLYSTEHCKKKYRMQFVILKQLLATAKQFTETIKNDI